MNRLRKCGLLSLVMAAMILGCGDSDTDIYHLTAIKSGGGVGMVFSTPVGIDCGDASG